MTELQSVQVCPVQPAAAAAVSHPLCVLLCHKDPSCFAARHSDTACSLASINEFFSPRWQSQPNSPAACSSFVKSTLAARQRVIDQLFHVFYDFREGFDNKVSVGDFTGLSATGVGVSTTAEGAELDGSTLNSFVMINTGDLMEQLIPSVGGWGQFANYSLFIKTRIGNGGPDTMINLVYLRKCSDKSDREMYLMTSTDASGRTSLWQHFLEGGVRTDMKSGFFDEAATRVESGWSSFLVSFNSSRNAGDSEGSVTLSSGFTDVKVNEMRRRPDKTDVTPNSRDCVHIGFHNSDTSRKLGGTVRCFGIGRPDIRLQDVRPLQLLC